MTRSVVFETSGILDLRSITIMGCSSKPRTDSPIGYFGTGLKYALAILAREGCEVTIMRGLDTPLQLTTKEIGFRDTTLSTIYLGEQELPFVTAYGKDWQLWQALRELESNTRDEGGNSYITEEDYENAIPIEAGYTKIIVTSDTFADEYENLDDIFLNTDKENVSELDSIEIYKQPSEYLFYRGIRVYTLPKPSEFTFNITRDMDLTENRTLQYWFIAEKTVAQAIGLLEDMDVLFNMLTNPDDFISTVDFEYGVDTLSTDFKKVVKDSVDYTTGSSDTFMSSSAVRLVEAIEEPQELERDAEQELTDLVDEIVVTILATAYEPSERGAGYSCDDESLEEVKELITTYIKEQNDISIF